MQHVIAERYSPARLSVLSLCYHGLEFLQIEFLRETRISIASYRFNNNKIVYLEIALETAS